MRRLGDYELLERVGAGGMAEVWLARRPAMADAVMAGAVKVCALKIIRPGMASQERYRRMFMQEACLVLKLSHANLVSVFDVGESDGRLFMAQEWVDGVHLRHFAGRMLGRGISLAIPEICHIIGELLHGLRYAHAFAIGGRSLGIVHRDISPHNVLVSAAGEVKLADFGIARVCGERSSGVHIKGKARYMAPEQLRGEASQASDLFSVGAILHELLEGRRFREGFERSADWHRVVAEASLPSLTRPGVPRPLEALRVGLLHPNPRCRINSADEALARLVCCPPWPSATLKLQALYRQHVGPLRRTGLTGSAPAALPTRIGPGLPAIIGRRGTGTLPGSLRQPSAGLVCRAEGEPRGSTAPSAGTRGSRAPRPRQPRPPLETDAITRSATVTALWWSTAAERKPTLLWVARTAAPSPRPRAGTPPTTPRRPGPTPGQTHPAVRPATSSFVPTGWPAASDSGSSPRPALSSRARASSAPALSPLSAATFARSRPEGTAGPRSSASSPVASRRRLHLVRRSLWLVAAVLGVTTLALVHWREEPSACIDEAPIAVGHRALLRLRSDNRPRAQVRIDMQIVEVAAQPYCWVSAGEHDFAWRASARDPWRSAGIRALVSAKEHLVRVGEDGMAISAYDP